MLCLAENRTIDFREISSYGLALKRVFRLLRSVVGSADKTGPPLKMLEYLAFAQNFNVSRRTESLWEQDSASLAELRRLVFKKGADDFFGMSTWSLLPNVTCNRENC